MRCRNMAHLSKRKGGVISGQPHSRHGTSLVQTHPIKKSIVHTIKVHSTNICTMPVLFAWILLIVRLFTDPSEADA